MMDQSRRTKASVDWLTPPVVIERLGPFDLDPCASVGQPWRTATTQLTIEDDGLSKVWKGYTWVNPPFNNCRSWVNKMCEHRNGVMLVPGRFECKWFLPLWGADALFFSFERWMFHYPKTGERCSNTWVGIVLAAFGKKAVSKLSQANLYGAYFSTPKIFVDGLRINS
jgi:DNA N-6-adenine-methyltransferase Dam